MLNRKPSSETLLRHFPALPDGEDVFDCKIVGFENSSMSSVSGLSHLQRLVVL